MKTLIGFESSLRLYREPFDLDFLRRKFSILLTKRTRYSGKGIGSCRDVCLLHCFRYQKCHLLHSTSTCKSSGGKTLGNVPRIKTERDILCNCNGRPYLVDSS